MASINNTNPGNRPLPDGELVVDITRPNRQMNEAVFKEVEARRVHEAEERAREAARLTHPDRVEVSADTRLMLAQSKAGKKSEAAEQKERAEELRRKYLEETLVTKERVEKAAEKLLGE